MNFIQLQVNRDQIFCMTLSSKQWAMRCLLLCKNKNAIRLRNLQPSTLRTQTLVLLPSTPLYELCEVPRRWICCRLQLQFCYQRLVLVYFSCMSYKWQVEKRQNALIKSYKNCLWTFLKLQVLIFRKKNVKWFS